jgi:hypothetical protein
VVRRLPAILLVVALAAPAGCGDDDEPATPQAPKAGSASGGGNASGGSSSGGTSEPQGGGGGQGSGGWTGVLAGTYKTAKLSCGAAGSVQEVAKELGLPASADTFTVAEEYSKGYQPEHQQPAFEGCLDGLP